MKSRYDYDPYGRRTLLSGTDLADFGFTGFLYHKSTGLNLTLFRAYDSDLGRWISRDPIGERGGLNLYGYVAGKPINRFDQLGLVPGDPTYGLPPEFWNWAHLQRQFNSLKGPDGNLSEQDALDMHEEWKEKGRPNPRQNKRQNKRCPGNDTDDWPDDWPDNWGGGNSITPIAPPYYQDPYGDPYGIPRMTPQQTTTLGLGTIGLIILMIIFSPVGV
jgi:RHS repeat-associated protein